MLEDFSLTVLFFLSQKNLLYFECQTRDVSKDLVDGETVSQQHLLQVSSLTSSCLHRLQEGPRKREAKLLSLILIFKAIASAETGREGKATQIRRESMGDSE